MRTSSSIIVALIYACLANAQLDLPTLDTNQLAPIPGSSSDILPLPMMHAKRNSRGHTKALVRVRRQSLFQGLPLANSPVGNTPALPLAGMPVIPATPALPLANNPASGPLKQIANPATAPLQSLQKPAASPLQSLQNPAKALPMDQLNQVYGQQAKVVNKQLAAAQKSTKQLPNAQDATKFVKTGKLNKTPVNLSSIKKLQRIKKLQKAPKAIQKLATL